MMVDGMESGMCSCDMDWEPVTLCDVRSRKARKEHRCDECHRTIRPGETYEFAKWLDDGDWWEQKRCKQCARIARDYCCGALGAGYVFEHVWEYLGVNLRTGEVRDAL